MPKARLRFTVEAPAPDPFEAVAGDDREYTVHHLEIPQRADRFVRAGLAAVVTRVVRLAPANITRKRKRIMFAWDPTYSTLTVTFSDGRQDGPDVVKLFCRGWDREIQALGSRQAATITASKISDISDWIEELATAMKRRLARSIRTPLELRFSNVNVDSTGYVL